MYNKQIDLHVNCVLCSFWLCSDAAALLHADEKCVLRKEAKKTPARCDRCWGCIGDGRPPPIKHTAAPIRDPRGDPQQETLQIINDCKLSAHYLCSLFKSHRGILDMYPVWHDRRTGEKGRTEMAAKAAECANCKKRDEGKNLELCSTGRDCENQCGVHNK